jgi:hypothetical protein
MHLPAQQTRAGGPPSDPGSWQIAAGEQQTPSWQIWPPEQHAPLQQGWPEEQQARPLVPLQKLVPLGQARH